MEKDYQFSHDLLMAEQTLHFTKTELAAYLHVDRLSLAKWENGETYPRPVSLESFYAFLYEKGVRLNEIKAELAQEENPTEKILFHDSRTGIEGPLPVEKSLPNKDFGKGFYCGESLSQSISFVALVPSSSVYLYAFDPSGLSHADFAVEQEWMLAIALFRGRLAPYQHHPLLRSIETKVAASDYVIAPIADNRMFEIITQFIDGEITDVQCQHCLSATDLGKQYVLLSPKALTRLRVLEHCYLSTPERAESLKRREEIAALGADKVKIARIRYRGQGHYLQEILA